MALTTEQRLNVLDRHLLRLERRFTQQADDGDEDVAEHGNELHDPDFATTGHGHGHADLSGVTANQHHAQNHAARHGSGGADAVSPSSIGAADDNHGHSHGSLSGVSANQHHNENHASRHAPGGADSVYDAGNVTDTTDGSGDVVVAHGIGVAPTFAVAIPQTRSPATWTGTVFQHSSTTFTVRVSRVSDAVLITNATVSFRWYAVA